MTDVSMDEIDEFPEPEGEIEPYVAGHYVDGHEDLVEVWTATGRVDQLVPDLRDPRWLLIVNGDMERGIPPIIDKLASMPIEVLRSRAIREVDQVCEAAEMMNIEIKGRLYSTQPEAYRRLQVIAKDAMIARSGGIHHEANYTCADGMTYRITGPEFIEAWISIQDRASAIVALRGSSIAKIKRAGSEADIQMIVEGVASRISEMAGL